MIAKMYKFKLSYYYITPDAIVIYLLRFDTLASISGKTFEIPETKRLRLKISHILRTY